MKCAKEILRNLLLLLVVVKGVSQEEQSLFPSQAPTAQNTSGDTPPDTCANYTCGDYSNAIEIRGGNNTGFNWSAKVPIKFIRAGVSCAFNPDRIIFDNDSIRGNNIKEMVWGANATGPRENVIQNLFNETNINIFGDRNNDTIDDYKGISIDIPSNIQIRVYAIDDHLKFKYRSYPCDLIEPAYDILPWIRFNNNEYTDSTVLKFVWNRNMTQRHFWTRLRPSDDIYDGGPNAATLELWIPNWILEKTTILGPRFDYSLAIEIGGTVNTGAIAPNAYSTNATSQNTTQTASGDDTEPNLLLTQGPPRHLTVYNSGIGTEVIIAINTTSDNPQKTELKYFDTSLNGEIKIQTDENVTGLIQLDARNMRAAIVRSIADDNNNAAPPPPGESVNIRLNGFQQVVTVRGNYNDIVLGGDSVALYTTEGCHEEDGVQNSGDQTRCIEIDNIFTEISPIYTSLNSSQTSALLRNQSISDSIDRTPGGLKPLLPFVELPSSCLANVNIVNYNCNPYSSGTTSSYVIRSILIAIIAGAMAMLT